MIPILGSTPLTAVLGSGVDSRNHTAVREYLRSCADLGLHVLFIKPNAKEPFDPRTPRQRNAADRVVQKQGEEEGRRGWAKLRSPAGLALATDDFKTLDKYLKQYIATFGDDVAVNLAIEVGGSGLIAVDCDTTEQRLRFIEETGADQELPPTVSSPGTMREGKWIHYDGGHYLFTVPEGWKRPENVGAFTWPGDDGFAVLWDRRYILIPPSIRPEGIYEVVGRDYECPPWLITEIENRASSRWTRTETTAAQFATGSDEDLRTAIDEWAEQTSWESILEPFGWVRLARTDGCGCEIWTAPGEHANPKSATTHDPGCSLGRYTETNAPMHIWSDHDIEPFGEYVAASGSNTLSKLQAVAYATYEGDIGKALDGLEIAADPVTLSRHEIDAEAGGHDPTEDLQIPEQPFDIEGSTNGKEEAAQESSSPFAMPEEGDDEDGDTFPGEDAPSSDIFDTGERDLPVIAPFSHWRDMPPPQYIIEGLVEHTATTCIIGAPGAGKSCVAIDMACSIATGRLWQGKKTMRTKVLYLPGEGLSGTVQRIKAWALIHGVPDAALDDGLRLGDDVLRVTASKESWVKFSEYVIREKIGLIIFDTFARTATGIEENSATDVGRAIFRFDKVRQLTGAGVMLVHHTAKGSPMSGRGSSALNAALESELLVTAYDPPERAAHHPGQAETVNLDLPESGLPTGARAIQIVTTKQKNAPLLEKPIPLTLVQCEEYSAPYVASETGSVDPMAGIGIAEAARPIEEPAVETAVRIRSFLEQRPEQGATRNEIEHGVFPDAYTVSRRDATRYWKLKVGMAIDTGLRLALLATASGQKLGARYTPGPVTPDAARAANAAQVMADDPIQD